MTIVKDLSLSKKLDCLRMKMCKGVRLRRMKVKGLAQKRQMRENTIPTDVSSKHEVCFMMKYAFKVMDKCLWYLDSGCLRHMTGDRFLFKVFESKKGGNVTFGDKSKSHIKGKGIISLSGLPSIANVLYVKGLRVNLLSISQICDQNFMVLFSKGKFLVMDESEKKLISGVCTLDNCYGLVPRLQNKKNLKIDRIQSDHGKEFKNSYMESFCTRSIISQEFSAPITPQRNGIVERKNRVI